MTGISSAIDDCSFVLNASTANRVHPNVCASTSQPRAAPLALAKMGELLIDVLLGFRM